LFLVDNRELTERVSAAIERTLALNPQDVSMLEIKAMNAFQNNDLVASLDWFRQAQSAGVDGERAELIQQAIDRLEEDLGIDAAESASPPSTIVPSPASSDAVDDGLTGQRRLEVLVEIAPGVRVDPQARVFVFARAMRGPPMPLAVQQMTVSALPRLVTLDETMGMVAGMSLADFDQVQVVARISSTGIANVSPDDYQALSTAVDMTVKNGVISLTLSRRVKDQ
jgi:cytochrome c-type biogenesis protein CcmH